MIMITRRLSYLLLAGSLLLTASCKKYLNTVPDNVLTIDDIFSSKTNVDAYLANIYSTMPDEMTQRFTGNTNSGPWEGASDEAKFNWDFVYTNKMVLSVWSNTDGAVETYWKSYYQAIRNATDFMNRIDNANAAELSPQLKTEYKAEARGLRALYYFFLLRTYGPVVLLGDNLISADASTDAVRLPRTSFDSCIDFVVKQMDTAYTDLPATPSSNSQLGRLVKGVVKAYKEQALFLAASPLYNGNTDYANLKNHNGEQLISQTYDVNKWKLAADAAKAFINEFSGTYHLYTESDPDPAKAAYLSCKNVMLVEWNPEWIFARPNSGSFMRYDKTPKHAGGPSDQTGAGAMGVTQTMVDAYFMANGLSINDPASGYVSNGFSSFQSPSDAVLGLPAHSTFNQWVNREPRFYVGVTYDSCYWLYQDPGYSTIITAYQYSGNSGRSQSTSDVSPTGYTVRKNVAPNDNDRGALLLRLANIYLDYAEALNEYDPTNPDILVYLNMIRQRAGVPQYGAGTGALPAPASQADMRTAIRKERRVELAFENVRYFDTRRWKIAPQTDAGPFYGMNMYVTGPDFYKKTLIETRVFQFRDYLFPIPNNEVLKDNLMVQNPGW
jgi:hypothetical protein